MALKDDLVFRLRGPHVNSLMAANSVERDEIDRLRCLCFEAADEIERLRQFEPAPHPDGRDLT